MRLSTSSISTFALFASRQGKDDDDKTVCVCVWADRFELTGTNNGEKR